MDGIALVTHVSQALGAARRSRKGRKFLDEFTHPPPDWAARNNATEYFEQSERLLQEGEVKLAALVRTRPEQLKPGRVNDDCLIVYSLDENVDPDALEALADRLRALHGKDSTESEQQMITRALNPNSAWIIGVPVPQSLNPPGRCLVSCTMGTRGCLPKGYFSGKSFPVVTLPDRPGLAMLVPFDYWPAELFRRWGAKPPGTNMEIGSLFGILLVGMFYLGAGAFVSSTLNTVIRSGASALKLNGSFWLLTGLNVVLLLCLAVLIKKSKSMALLQASDLNKRPWHKRFTSLPITQRVSLGVSCVAYLGGLILGLF